VSEVVGLKDVDVEDLVWEVERQCGRIQRFDDVGNGAWKGALSEGKRVVVITRLEDLPSGEDERREVLADNGIFPFFYQLSSIRRIFLLELSIDHCS
jgi:hypothetical protein